MITLPGYQFIAHVPPMIHFIAHVRTHNDLAVDQTSRILTAARMETIPFAHARDLLHLLPLVALTKSFSLRATSNFFSCHIQISPPQGHGA